MSIGYKNLEKETEQDKCTMNPMRLHFLNLCGYLINAMMNKNREKNMKWVF